MQNGSHNAHAGMKGVCRFMQNYACVQEIAAKSAETDFVTERVLTSVMCRREKTAMKYSTDKMSCGVPSWTYSTSKGVKKDAVAPSVSSGL